MAVPLVHLGTSIEIDLATFETGEPGDPITGPEDGGGGTATATWAPPLPTLAVEAELPEADEYEVRVTTRGRRLVAAVEIVSPSNKDRPEHRRSFVAKCAALMRERVCVAIVDIMMARNANLYGDILDHFGQDDRSLEDGPPTLLAAACRWTKPDGRGGLDASPGDRPAVADAPPLARHGLRRPSRSRSEL